MADERDAKPPDKASRPRGDVWGDVARMEAELIDPEEDETSLYNSKKMKAELARRGVMPPRKPKPGAAIPRPKPAAPKAQALPRVGPALDEFENAPTEVAPLQSRELPRVSPEPDSVSDDEGTVRYIPPPTAEPAPEPDSVSDDEGTVRYIPAPAAPPVAKAAPAALETPIPAEPAMPIPAEPTLPISAEPAVRSPAASSAVQGARAPQAEPPARRKLRPTDLLTAVLLVLLGFLVGHLILRGVR